MYKYKEPTNPSIKFQSDLARELSTLNFPIYYGDKKDNKVYNTLAFCLERSDDCPIFEHIDSSELWIWTSNGSGKGLTVQVESDNRIQQGPTWTVEEFDSANPVFQVMSVTRGNLAKTIVDGFKKLGDYEKLFDELIIEADNKIKENEKLIEERLIWIEDTTGQYDDWMKKRFNQQITSSQRLIKDLKNALDEPELPVFQDNQPDTNPNFYLVTAVRNYDNKTVPFCVEAFNKIEVRRKLNSKSIFFSRRDLRGSKKDPTYDFQSLEIVKEFKTRDELLDYVTQRFNATPINV